MPRKSVIRLPDHPDMTLDVYSGRKTTTTTTLLYILSDMGMHPLLLCCLNRLSRICTVSFLISKKSLTEYGRQPYGPPCGIQYQCKSSLHH